MTAKHSSSNSNSNAASAVAASEAVSFIAEKTSGGVGRGGSVGESDEVYQKIVHNEIYIDRLPSPVCFLRATRLAAWLGSIKGFLFGFLAAFCFALASTCARKAYLLAGSDHLTVLFVITLLVMSTITRLKRLNPLGNKAAAQQRLFLSLRGVLGTLNLVCFYSSIMLIAPSDALAISNGNIIIVSLLARFAFGERLSVSHLLSMALIIFGAFLISKPTFLFHNASPQHVLVFLNATSMYHNATGHGLVTVTAEQQDARQRIVYGVMLAVAAAVIFGLNSIVIKKLCNLKVDWSIISIYSAFYGLPFSLAISLLTFKLGMSHANWQAESELIAGQMGYSVLSACIFITGSVSFSKSLEYEDATKIAIAKTTEVLFSFVLQMIVLDIRADIFSVSGSLAILGGTSLILSYKLITRNRPSVVSHHKQEDKEEEEEEGEAFKSRQTNCFVKVFLLEF